MSKKRLKLTLVIIAVSILTSFLIPFALAAKPTTPRIKIRPTEGKPGDIIKIHGMRFTPIEGTRVNIILYDEDGDWTLLRRFDTDKNGKFKETFTVPAVYPGNYTLVVEDSYGLNASIPFKVYIYDP